MNVYLPLEMAAEAMGWREAVVCGEVRLSYEALAEKARHVALLPGQGEKIGYLGEASPLLPAALFGAALAGTQFVPLNYRLPAAQIRALLGRVSPVILFTDKAITADGVIPHPLAGALSDTPLPGSAARDEPQGSGGDVAIELFTSGTTGAPKSALLRHEHIMAYILATTEFMSAGEDEATLIAVPPYHIAGISAILSATYAGRRMVQLPQFSADMWLDLARAEKVTHAFLVPTMLQRIFEEKDIAPLPNLRHIAYGGGRMPRDVIERAMDRWPDVNFTNAYGLTETSSTISLLTPEAHRAARTSDDPAVRRRLHSVGMALPSVEIEVRDENDAPCAPEAVGFVHVRGAQVSGTYQGAGSLLDTDGFFPTRDRGFVDAAGYLFLDGREDDVIVRGGENISPGEIEDVIRDHPGIRDVAVVAVPDTEWGEAVGAAIIVDGEVKDDALRALVRKKLRSSRVPSIIRRVEMLPYTETGKLLRRVIRDDLASDLPGTAPADDLVTGPAHDTSNGRAP